MVKVNPKNLQSERNTVKRKRQQKSENPEECGRGWCSEEGREDTVQESLMDCWSSSVGRKAKSRKRPIHATNFLSASSPSSLTSIIIIIIQVV